MFAKSDRLKAEQAYQNALDDLSAMLGTEESIVVVEPKLYATLSPEFEILGGVVAKKRKDLKRLGAQISAADKNVQVARSVYYPQLNLEASYLNQRETNITEPDIWEAGIRLEWSLFEAGKTDAEVAKAKAESLRLKHLRKDLERSADNEIKTALRLVRENEALVEAHQLQLLATEQEHTYQLELYHAGKRKKLDVLTSRVRLATENARYRVSINHLRTSLVALETALSMPIDGQLTPKEPHQITLESLDTMLSTPASPPVLKANPKSLVSDNYPYVIQLGAFLSEEKARLFLNSLKKDFPNTAFDLISTGGWQKVRAIHFATREAASAALVELGREGFIVHANTDHRRTD
jgi:cell division septation protein DedD